MQYIPMNILEYRFDDRGITQSIIVAFQIYDGDAHFSARVPLTQEIVTEQNPNLELDRMNKEQADNIARRVLRNWTTIEPSEDEEPVVDEDDPTGSIPEGEDAPVV